MTSASGECRDRASGCPIAVSTEDYVPGSLVRPDARDAPSGQSWAMFLTRRRRRAKQRRLAPGSYLTDGQNLFRVNSLLVSGASMLATIEDCLTLETRSCSATELDRMRDIREARA